MRTLTVQLAGRLAVLLVVAGLAACGVPKSKHNEVLEALKKCQDESASCIGDRDTARKRGDELEGKLADMTTERDDAIKAGEATKAELDELAANLAATKEEIERLRKARAEAEKRLQAFKDLTARFQKMIDTGKVKVQFRRGQMILELPAGILFASGKAELSKEGKEALAEVAKILVEFSDRRWAIGGHTDNVPLRGSKLKDNWELSTARALTVTKFLIAEGVAPAQLSASGFGEFDPVADNTTDEGRQANRRIEIILVPNIEELPQLPEDSATQPSP